MMLYGVDISNNQGVIDWPAVAAAGVAFALIKASEGVTYEDPYRAQNILGAAQSGILVGVYHFALPATNTPHAEAAWFRQCVGSGPLPPGCVIALDMEQDPYGNAIPTDCGPWVESWMLEVQGDFGCLPMLYTNLDLIQNHGLDTPGLGLSGLWLAAPNVPLPPAPAPWPFIATHQRSWTGRIPGINGAVDLNTFFGDAAAWKSYGIPQSAPEPIPEPKVPTNDDRIYFIKCVTAEPCDLVGLQTAIQPFLPAH